MIRRAITSAAVLAALLVFTTPALAQSVGIGPRLSFVRGDLLTNTPATRLLGGSLRMMSSKHMALELSLDFRTQLAQDGASRLRETPIQGSILLYPVRAAFAPYVLGGAGIYTQTLDTLDGIGTVTSTSVQRRIGWHLGAGAEIRLFRHAFLYADYRFRFVKFGEPPEGSAPVPGSSLVGVKVSHQGSMWTSGIQFCF